MSSDLAESILGSLILNPALLETVHLSDHCFEAGRERKTFSLITLMWEDQRPKTIDPVILAEHLGGNGAAGYIASLTDGVPSYSVDFFLRRVIELRKKRLVLKMLSPVKQALDYCLRTRQTPNFDPIREDLAEYDLLSQPEEPRIVSVSDYQAEHIEWLWAGRVPLGMLTLLVSSPGVGKSFLTVALASKLSIGEPLPDSGNVALKCSSLFLAAEDPPSEIRLRAEANGADCSKINILFEDDQALNIKKLKRALSQNSDIKLVVIDPLNAYLPASTDYFKDPEVRRNLLQPLARLAQETKVAILAVVHLNKNEDAKAIHRVAGSVGYSAVARSVLAIGPDPEDEDLRLVLPIKCNYAKKANILAFRIAPFLKLTFGDAPLDVNAEEVLGRTDWAGIRKRSFVVNWLKGELQNGPMEYRNIKERAKGAGISEGRLHRAADHLRIVPQRRGVGESHTSIWELPQHDR